MTTAPAQTAATPKRQSDMSKSVCQITEVFVHAVTNSFRAQVIGNNDKVFVRFELDGKEKQLLEAAGFKLSKEASTKFTDPRPSVKLVKHNNGWKIASVWNAEKGAFMGVDGSEEAAKAPEAAPAVVTKPETPKSVTKVEPPAPKTPSTIEVDALRDKIKAVLADTRKNRLKAQADVVSDPKLEEARVAQDSIVAIDGMMSKFGVVQLGLQWHMFENGYHKQLGFESVAEAMQSTDVENTDYAKAMGRVVDTIFAEVAAMAKAGTPYVHPVTGQEVTPELLIATPGLINKLKVSTTYWESVIDRDTKQIYLSAIFTKPREQLAALRDVNSHITNTPQAADGIRAKIETVKGEKGMTLLTMKLNEKQLNAVQRLLKKIVTFDQ